MGKTYPITEIFTSIQGEGFHAGTPCSFIRLAGCNLNCAFCDTDYTERMKLTPQEILDYMDPGPSMVVITGGEPTIHDLWPLFKTLHDAGHKVHIETNGTKKLECHFDWVTVSPKVGARLVKQNYDEAKWLIPEWSAKTIDWLLAIHTFLQPVWGDNYNKNLNLCLDMLKDFPQARLSLQIQKWIGAR